MTKLIIKLYKTTLPEFMNQSQGFFLNPPWSGYKHKNKTITMDTWLKKTYDGIQTSNQKGWLLIPLFDNLTTSKDLFYTESRQNLRKLFSNTEKGIILNGVGFEIFNEPNYQWEIKSKFLSHYRTMALLISNKKNYSSIIFKMFIQIQRRLT